MSEREPGENRTGNHAGEIAEQIHSQGFVFAVGKLCEDEPREFLRNSCKPELSKMTVELADRLADVFHDEKSAGQIGKIRSAAERRQQSQIDGNNAAVCRSGPEFR